MMVSMMARSARRSKPALASKGSPKSPDHSTGARLRINRMLPRSSRSLMTSWKLAGPECGSSFKPKSSMTRNRATCLTPVREPRRDVCRHPVGADPQDVEAVAGGHMGERVRDMDLADADLSTDEHVAVLVHEGAGGQVGELLAVAARLEAEVEAPQGLGAVDAAAATAEVELLVAAPLDLVLDEPAQELLVGLLLGDGLLGADLEPGQDAREAQPFEVGGEHGVRHRAPPKRLATNSPARRTKVSRSGTAGPTDTAWYVDAFWQELHDHCVAHVNIDSPGGAGANHLSRIRGMAET